MPIYDYRCDVCDHRVEVVHGLHGHGPRVCPSCGAEGAMRKLLSAPTIVFKGSGWAKKDRSATAAPGKTQAQKSGSEPASSDSKPAESKAAGSQATTSESSAAGAASD
ncbi:MAG TPA: zinc ribbon domain-containing protein [Candidatus Dormibacteraeota bacterium]|nr:zinc ribbon domain-containing protein [Candidatus Dormibacteraeota bacterium]